MALFSESLATLMLLGGAVLMLAEAVMPGTHFFVLGVALLTAGLVGLLIPIGGILGIVILAVAVLAVTGLTLFGYRQLDIYGGEGAARTLDSNSLRGKFGRVTERVTTRGGEIKIEDGGFNPFYQARSTSGEIPEGEEVMVIDGGGGNVVTVEPVTGDDDEIDRQLARDRAATAEDSDDEVSGERPAVDGGDEADDSVEAETDDSVEAETAESESDQS